MTNPPLFQHYPKLARKFSYATLGSLPTPVKHYPAIAKNLWVKHDDLSGDIYGGNKTRKLEFILPQVKQLKKHHVITFGGTGTHHGLATALYCQELGIDCTVLLFNQEPSPTEAVNYAALEATNATLIHCGSVFKTALRFYLTERLRHPSAYYLFAGGSGIEGCLALVNACFELKQQINDGTAICPDVIFCAVGSAGTCAGLTLGCQLADLPIEVIGVRVIDSHLGLIPTCTERTAESLMEKTLKAMKACHPEITQPTLKAKFIGDYYGEGYGIATKEGQDAAKLFAANGITLEQTYTAKTAAAVLDYCQNHPDQNVLYWHTYNSRALPRK
jgi:D-cysteine desulfhydrase